MKKLIFCFIIFTVAFIQGCSDQDDPIPQEKGRIIVLMYHRIVNGEASNIYERSLTNLEADLKYLQDNNIKVLSFNDLEQVKSNGQMPEGNSAIITFDDGDNSWYILVRPLLLKYKMKATFFLWTYMMGHNSFITWDEVADMSNYSLKDGERPFVFGSHTYSHSYLSRNKDSFANQAEYDAFLDYELGRSKENIEQYSPGLVDILSLPYGDGAGDPDIIAAAKRNGYRFIRTSIWASIDNPDIDLFKIPSLPMLDSTESDLIGDYLGI